MPIMEYYINHDLLGYDKYIVYFSFNNSFKENSKIFEFLKLQPFISVICKCFGEYDAYIELYTENNQGAYNFIEILLKKYSHLIREYDLLLIRKFNRLK